jgi:hypothetical protein
VSVRWPGDDHDETASAEVIGTLLGRASALPSEPGWSRLRCADPADRRCADPAAELEQFALDPLVSPAVILSGEPPDERSDLRADWRPARAARIAPLPCDQAALAAGVPAGEIEPLSDLFARVLDGHNAHLTDGVELVLGRRPRDFAGYAHDTAATGIWSPAAAGGPR